MAEEEDYTEELQKKLVKAAEYGKMLLEENETLKIDMDDVRRHCDTKIEESVQKVHSLQVKIEQMTSQGAWYSEEIGHLKQQLADKQDHLRETIETGKQLEIGKLNRQVEELRSELDHQQILKVQLEQKISELEDLVQEKLNRTEHEPNRSFGLSEEVTLLQEEVNTLQNEVMGLKSELIAKRSELGSMVSEAESLRGKIHARDEEIEDIKCQFTTVNNSLEQVRFEKLELKCQLDALQMENNSHANKGNSIFSELDDRRVDAEKKLISLKLSNDSLAEKYTTEREQNKKLKRHITHLLLETTSGRIDSEYVTGLERKLAHTMQELKVALEEKEHSNNAQVGGVSVVPDQGQTEMADAEYTQFLTTVIDGKEQELQRVKKDLSQKSLQLLDQKVRITSQDSRLAQLAAEKAKLQTQNIRLHNKVQEMKLKYEPDSVKDSAALTIKRTEKIPLDDVEDVKITETSRIHDNSTINQSQLKTQNAADQSEKSKLRPSQPLVKTISKSEENVPKRSALSKCVKTKTVSISDDIEEHEIENVEAATKSYSEKQKGRTITAVKHITASDKNVNECKNQ